jgi:hypothetical protein
LTLPSYAPQVVGPSVNLTFALALMQRLVTVQLLLPAWLALFVLPFLPWLSSSILRQRASVVLQLSQTLLLASLLEFSSPFAVAKLL